MKSHAQIMLAVGRWLQSDGQVTAEAVRLFGRPLSVCVGAYGALGLAGEEEAPFVQILAVDSGDIGNVDVETFDAALIVGAVPRADGGADVEVFNRRTETESGLVRYGIAHVVEAMRDYIWDRIAETAPAFGAPVLSAHPSEITLSAYPLQTAQLVLRFDHPKTLRLNS